MSNSNRARSLVPLALLFGAGNLSIGFVYPIISLILQERAGMGERELGLFWGIASIAGGLAFAAWGLAGDGRLGRRRGLALAIALYTGAAVLAMVGPEAAVPSALLAFLVAESGLAPLLDTITLDALAGRTAQYSRLRSAGSAGFGVAALALTPLLAAFDWLGLALVTGVAGLVAVLTALRLRERPVRGETRPHLRDLIGLPRRAPAFGRLALIGAIAAIPSATIFEWFVPLLRDHGFDPRLAPIGSGLTALVEVPVLFAVARFGERSGWRAPFVAGALLYVPIVAAMALPLELPALMALRMSAGVAYALLISGAVVLVRELVPAHLVATGQGLLQLSLFGLAPSLAGLIGGTLWPLLGPASLVALSLFGLVGGIAGARLLPAGRSVHHTRTDRGVEPVAIEPPA
jgi:MFS family permease